MTVEKIHQDDPWYSPTLEGVIHMNDDYIWVTQHTVATQDAFTSLACPPLIPTTQHKTASLYHSHYADVLPLILISILERFAGPIAFVLG